MLFQDAAEQPTVLYIIKLLCKTALQSTRNLTHQNTIKSMRAVWKNSIKAMAFLLRNRGSSGTQPEKQQPPPLRYHPHHFKVFSFIATRLLQRSFIPTTTTNITTNTPSHLPSTSSTSQRPGTPSNGEGNQPHVTVGQFLRNARHL